VHPTCLSNPSALARNSGLNPPPPPPALDNPPPCKPPLSPPCKPPLSPPCKPPLSPPCNPSLPSNLSLLDLEKPFTGCATVTVCRAFAWMASSSVTGKEPSFFANEPARERSSRAACGCCSGARGCTEGVDVALVGCGEFKQLTRDGLVDWSLLHDGKLLCDLKDHAFIERHE